MKKEMSRTVNFGKGQAVVTVTLQNKKIDMDGDQWESKNVEKNINIEISSSDGKVVAESPFAQIIEDNNSNRRYMENAKLDLNKKYTRVGKVLAEGVEAHNAINTAVEEIENELAQEFGVKTEKEMKQEEEIEEAQAIVKAAEKQGIENLMTASELKIWRANYNRLHNEGGEGYIPARVSKEKYQRALEVLSQ